MREQKLAVAVQAVFAIGFALGGPVPAGARLLRPAPPWTDRYDQDAVHRRAAW